MAQQYSSFYPTTPVMPDPSRSSAGFEFIPGRSRHDGASQPFVNVAPAWSIYQQSSGSEYGVAYDALVSRSGITRAQPDLESQSTRRTSSENRHSQSTSPSSFDGNVEPEPFVQLSPKIIQRKAPPNAPKGPAAERGGRQLSRHPGTRQGNPPPNAPKAPAALRMQLATLTNGSSHQHLMSAANGHFSSSKTWISPDAELRAKFGKFKKELQVMGCRESVVFPLSFNDFKDDLELCKVRRREMRNRLQQAQEARVHRETGPSVRFLSGVFDPSFVDTWSAAGESNGWPSRMEYRRLGDNNRVLPRPQRQGYNQEEDCTSKWSHMASYSHHAASHAAFHAGAREGPLHMTIYDTDDDADNEADDDANGIDDFHLCQALVKELFESRDGTSASIPANVGEL